jgi:hypothetical protein
MARIPRLNNQSRVQVQAAPGVTSSGNLPQSAFGADVSGAAEGIANIAMQYKNRMDTARVMEADSSLTEFENTALYDPENGALNLTGKNAFGAPDKVMADFDRTASDIRHGLNGSQQVAFDKMTAQRRQQIQKTMNRHVANQAQAYEQEQLTSLIAGSQITASNYYNDPGRIQTELQRQTAALMASAQDNGWSPEKTQLAIREARANTHGAVLNRLAATDTNQAMTYYAKHANEMTPAVQAKYDAGIKVMRDRQTAESVVAGIVGGQGVGADGVWSRMIQQESGGNQLNKDGTTVTSPKGARGIAQVMPDTAKETAAKMGIPWDEERYMKDPEYNMALGKAYYDEQIKTFGDPMLAAAAYNAGPGSVSKWIAEYGDPRTGEISRQEFASKIPFKETRDYVAKVAPPNTVEPGLQLTRSQQMAAVEGLPANIRDDAKDRLKALHAVEDQQKAELFNQLQLEVERGGSFDDLPVEAVNQMDAKQMKALRSRSQELAGVEIETDWRKWTEVSTMSRTELAAIKDPYTELRPHLDDALYKKALTMVNEAKGIGTEGDAPETSSTLTFNQMIKNSANLVGITPADKTPAKWDEDETLAYARFQNEAAARVEAWERQNGRKATGQEQQSVIDELLTETVMVDGGWLGGDEERYSFTLDEDDLGDAYVPIADIPTEDAEFVRNLLRSNGFTAENAVVQRAYAQYKLGNTEAFQKIISEGK